MKKKISRNRFQEIKRYFHLADNDNLQQADKLAKVRTYLNLMQRNFLRFGVFSKHLSIDKQMVPYYGHFSTKMFKRNKPVKFGMKIWFLASAQGYSFSFDVYTGKDMSSSEPLGERVVNKLTAVLENYSNHAFFFDNFFSSKALCRDLIRKSLRCIGTIRQNRTQNCPLTLPAVMKKNERGVFETYSDGEVVLCQWNDNKPVCIVSNFKGTEPTNTVRRWSAAKKSKINITQPEWWKVTTNTRVESISLIAFLVSTDPDCVAKSGGGVYLQTF